MLVTRPQPGADATAARLVALGFEPAIAPLLAVEHLACDLPPPDGLGAVLATSGNAVDAIPGAWRGLPLFAVGDATAARARAAGFATAKLGATLTGVPFYARHGYVAGEREETPLPGGETMSVVHMTRRLVG